MQRTRNSAISRARNSSGKYCILSKNIKREYIDLLIFSLSLSSISIAIRRFPADTITDTPPFAALDEDQ